MHSAITPRHAGPSAVSSMIRSSAKYSM